MLDSWKEKPVVVSKTPPFLDIGGVRHTSVTITSSGIKKEGRRFDGLFSTKDFAWAEFYRLWGDLEFPAWRCRPTLSEPPVKFGACGSDGVVDFDVLYPPGGYDIVYAVRARVWVPADCDLANLYRDAA